MPTLDDLRDVLVAREAYAGDPAVVRQFLHSNLPETSQNRSTSRLLAPVAAAAAVLAVGIGTAAVVSSHGDNDSAATEPVIGTRTHAATDKGEVRARKAADTRGLPELPSAAIRQLHTNGVDVTKTSSGASPISENDVIKAVFTAMGLARDSAVAASLATITTPGMGKDGANGKVARPLYSNRLVWAIEYANVRIPIRGSLGYHGPAFYTANMVAFVDATNGTWLFASQVNPS